MSVSQEQVQEAMSGLVRKQHVLKNGSVAVLQMIVQQPEQAITIMLDAVAKAIDAEKAAQPPFSIVSTFTLPAVPAKPQSECFKDDIWHPNGRDSDLDRWFKKDQPAADTTEFSVVVTNKDSWQPSLALEWAIEQVTGTRDHVGKPTLFLQEEAIRLGLTLTCAQAEKSAELTEQGTETGLLTNGYGNFYLTETGDAENPVAVGLLPRADSWRSYVFRIGRGGGWSADRRLLLRNLKVASAL
jgi:hypothetical protein